MTKIFVQQIKKDGYNLKQYINNYSPLNYLSSPNKFRKTAKNPPYNYGYTNGFKKWITEDMITFALIVGTFRIMFGIKKEQRNTCG